MAGGEEMFEDKEGKKKMEKDTVEIKIRFNRFWLERAIYIVVILILIGLLFYNPFGAVICGENKSEVTSVPVVSEPEPEVEGPEIEEEPVVETEPEPEPEPEEEPDLSGEATLTIDKIKLDENKTKVESITIKINNQYKIFTPLVWVYWYDKDSVGAVKEFPNGGKISFTGAIPLRQTSVKKLDDELKAHYLRTDDDRRETFKVELYDASDKTLLDSKTKSIATD